MGHSGTRMLDRYVHPDQKHQRRAMENFEAAYGNIVDQAEKVQ